MLDWSVATFEYVRVPEGMRTIYGIHGRRVRSLHNEPFWIINNLGLKETRRGVPLHCKSHNLNDHVTCVYNYPDTVWYCNHPDGNSIPQYYHIIFIDMGYFRNNSWYCGSNYIRSINHMSIIFQSLIIPENTHYPLAIKHGNPTNESTDVIILKPSISLFVHEFPRHFPACHVSCRGAASCTMSGPSEPVTRADTGFPL